MWETITITLLGHNKQVLFDLMRDAQRNAVGESKGKLIVYTTFGHEWRKFGNPRHRRPIESVVLPQVCGSCSRWRCLIALCQHSDRLGCYKHWCVRVCVLQHLSERIRGDVTEFLANELWYQDRGVPFRRG